MLREISAKQRKGEPRRRWFYSHAFELVVWLDEDESVIGIQLAYDKDAAAHALTWRQPDHFHLAAVDTGETHPLKPKASPILVADGAFEPLRIAEQFRAASASVPAEYSELVQAKIREFGAQRGSR